MAFCTIEDQDCKAELIIFPKIYKKYEEKLKGNSLFIFTGDVSEQSKDSIKIKVHSLIPLHEFQVEKDIKLFNFALKEDFLISDFKEIAENFKSNEGVFKSYFSFFENNNEYNFYLNKKINLNFEFHQFLKNKNIKIKPIFLF